MEKKKLFGRCPYVTAQKVLTGKWSMYIMYLLTDGPIRFNELQRKMPEEMTHTTLKKGITAVAIVEIISILATYLLTSVASNLTATAAMQ